MLFIALAPVVATALALALYFTLLRYDDIETSLQQRGQVLARQLAAAVQYGLFSGNTADLARTLNIVQREPDVIAVAIYDRHDQPILHTGAPTTVPALPVSEDWFSRSESGNAIAFHRNVIASTLALDDPYAEKPAANLKLGSITVELSRKNVIARKREILVVTTLATLIILLMAGFLATRLGRDITEPVMALEDMIKRIREGQLDARVAYHRAGTLQALEEGINDMAATLERNDRRNTEALATSRTQLQQQNEFASALLEAQSKAGVCMITMRDDKIVFANSAALDFFGITIEAMQQTRVSHFVVREFRGKFEYEYALVLSGLVQASRMELRAKAADNERWADVAIFGVTRDGKRQVAIVGIDVTQRKLDAQRLADVHRTLQKQRDQAELASTAKSRFLAAASHDLRQPLHALALFTNRLREEVSTEPQSDIANQIAAATSDMSELLDSLLDISRLDLATLNPSIGPVALQDVLDHVAAMHSTAAGAKQLRLRIVPTALKVSTDTRYLSRILSNLASNAIRYTQHGGIVIGARRMGDQIRIEVRDSGVGIEEHHLPFIFQEFYQVANPERDASKGLGLGLAIVERLATALGHRLSARSTPGRGSTFSVTVPRAPAGEPLLDSAPSTEGRVLLALANHEQREELASLLDKWGYAATSVSVDDLQDSSSDADIVICDREALGIIARTVGPLGAKARFRLICTASAMDWNHIADLQSCAWLPQPIKPARLRALMLHLMQ